MTQSDNLCGSCTIRCSNDLQVDISHFNQPCNNIYHQSDAPVSKSWFITVIHDNYILNLTIYKAYSPYSHMCHSNYIQMYNGNTTNNLDWVGEYCGHVGGRLWFSCGEVQHSSIVQHCTALDTVLPSTGVLGLCSGQCWNYTRSLEFPQQQGISQTCKMTATGYILKVLLFNGKWIGWRCCLSVRC